MQNENRSTPLILITVFSGDIISNYSFQVIIFFFSVFKSFTGRHGVPRCFMYYLTTRGNTLIVKINIPSAA